MASVVEPTHPRTSQVDSIRLGPWQQAAVYGATALLVISGAVWLVFHCFVVRAGQFGPMIHPMEPWMLSVHGAAAMAALVAYGSLLPVHVRRSWRVGRNLRLGIGLGTVMSLLTVSGYLLYYAADERSRPIISAGHWSIGLAVPALLWWHVASGRSSTRGGRR